VHKVVLCVALGNRACSLKSGDARTRPTVKLPVLDMHVLSNPLASLSHAADPPELQVLPHCHSRTCALSSKMQILIRTVFNTWIVCLCSGNGLGIFSLNEPGSDSMSCTDHAEELLTSFSDFMVFDGSAMSHVLGARPVL
jgi:hypothetical protein